MGHPILFEPVDSPYLVRFDDSFKISKAPTEPSASSEGQRDGQGKASKEANVLALAQAVEQLSKLQNKLYAHHRYSVLLVFQGMDASGKDGTIRAVLSGINPQGCQVVSFKAPNSEELDHDFLWRIHRAMPERGRIGVFNRSQYEEVLTLRVNPSLLDHERLPRRPELADVWEERYESINAAEKHWARNGCVILKFFLNVSQKKQHERFLARVSDPEDFWKFNANDMVESRKWELYMEAYQAALRATSKPWAPWYAIPADSKSHMRRTVAEITVATLRQLKLAFPTPSEQEKLELERVRNVLEVE